MKGLKKIALASTIAAVSAGAQAELKALDDAMMSELTGQKGLTIDIETEWSIGEFAYQDAGLVVLKDLSMGGKGNVDSKAAGTGPVLLDNIRLILDVAGSGIDDQGNPNGDNVSHYGMSKVAGLAKIHALAGQSANNPNTADFAAASTGLGDPLAGMAGRAEVSRAPNGQAIDNMRISGDGDLTLHFGFNDGWAAAGGLVAFHQGQGTNLDGQTRTYADLSWDEAEAIVAQSVDFEFAIGQIALADSAYATDGRLGNEEILKASGNFSGIDDDSAAGTNTTTLISDLKMSGYLGPMDIRIQNNGNGFSGGNLGAGTGAADSKIEWDSFFRVTDLDLYIDIAGVKLEDIQIHNTRGDTTSLNTVAVDTSGTVNIENTASFGFAHSKREIFAIKDGIIDTTTFLYSGLDLAAAHVDGIAINTRFKGDIDIGAIKFGNTDVSLGAIYMTDVQSTTNWTISAH